jgi:SAM-dependent methyltransferase
MTKKPYPPAFYTRELDRARTSAETIVPLVLQRVAPRSVVDLGCGHGIWLETFSRHGVADYIGVDGDWVPLDKLHFPQERFVSARLDKPLHLGRRFDLAVSLEVAEHLPPRGARRFVQNIVELAPCVLFSAAVPYQRGTDHLNEQWPELLGRTLWRAWIRRPRRSQASRLVGRRRVRLLSPEHPHVRDA